MSDKKATCKNYRKLSKEDSEDDGGVDNNCSKTVESARSESVKLVYFDGESDKSSDSSTSSSDSSSAKRKSKKAKKTRNMKKKKKKMKKKRKNKTASKSSKEILNNAQSPTKISSTVARVDRVSNTKRKSHKRISNNSHDLSNVSPSKDGKQKVKRQSSPKLHSSARKRLSSTNSNGSVDFTFDNHETSTRGYHPVDMNSSNASSHYYTADESSFTSSSHSQPRLSSSIVIPSPSFVNHSQQFYHTPPSTTPHDNSYRRKRPAADSSSEGPAHKRQAMLSSPIKLPTDFLTNGGDFSLSYHPREPHNSEIEYHPCFLDYNEANHLFNTLYNELAWQQRDTQVRGEYFKEPRLTCWFGVPYTYSGVVLEANHVWHPLLAALKDRLASFIDAQFNSLLCNLYRNGRDSIGWHSDDEPSLGRYPIIASISLGCERQFELRTRKMCPPFDLNSVGRHLALPLKHGSLLVMRGATQVHWLHSVPKDTTLFHFDETRGPVSRINLTFRYTYEGEPPNT